MATKAGEAFYEVYPQLNKTIAAQVRQALGKDMSDAFADGQKKMQASQKETHDQALSQNDELGKARKDVSQDVRRNIVADEKNITSTRLNSSTTAARSEQLLGNLRSRLVNDAINDESNLRTTRSKGATSVSSAEQKAGGIRRLAVRGVEDEENKLSGNRNRANKVQTSALHSIATQFRTIGTITRGLSAISIVPLGFQGLVSGIGLIRAALPIVGAGLIALPGLIASAGVESLVLKKSFQGVGGAISDAFNPAKVKQYNAELQKLSPSARSFVKSIAALKNVKLPDLQEAFFSNKSLQKGAKGVAPAAKAVAPALKPIAAASGGLTGGLLQGLTSPQSVKDVKSLFAGMAAGIKAVTPGARVLEQGLLDIVGKDGAFGATAGKSVGDFFTKLGHYLSTLNVAKVFHDAGVAIHGFAQIGKNALGFFSAIGKALGTKATGGTFLTTLNQIFLVLNKFSNSKPGQKFLTELFTTLSELSHTVGVVLFDALNLLATTFAGLQPSVGPFLNEIEKLAKDLVPLGPVIGQIGKYLLSWGTGALKVIEPLLKAVVKTISDHPKLFAAFAAGIIVATAAMAAFNAVMDANPVVLVGVAIAALVVGVIYAYKHFKTFRDAVDAVGNAFKNVWKAIQPALKQLGDKLVELWNKAQPAVNLLKILIPGALKVMGAYMTHVTIPLIKGLLVTWIKVFTGIIDIVISVINGIIRTINALKNFFTKTVPGWISFLKNWFVSTYDSIRNRTVTFWKSDILGSLTNIKNFFIVTIPGWATTLKNKVNSAFDTIKSRVHTLVVTDIEAVFNSIKTFITKTVPGWFTGLIHSVTSPLSTMVQDISNIWKTLSSVFETPVKFVINTVLGAADGLVHAWNFIDSGVLGGHHQIKAPTFSNPSPPAQPTIPKYAQGGQTPFGMVSKALGGPTQDNVNINVSGGEYITKASSVRDIEQRAPGYLNALNKYGGKAISGDPSGIHIFNPHQQKFSTGGPVSAGAGIVSRAPAVLNWLKSIAGRVPYVLGGNGPNSFDCSSLVGNVWARLTNNPINRRYFVTGTEANWLLSHGFAPGADRSGFTVGLTSPPEHTVGMLAGHRFEAAHTGTKMRFDDGAANALNFSRVFHMIGLSNLAGSVGLPPALAAVATAAKFKAHFAGIIADKMKGAPQTAYTPEASLFPGAVATNIGKTANPLIASAVKAFNATANAGFGAGTALGALGSGNEDRWIAQASQFSNIPASWVPMLKYIMNHESGGNPNAQNNTDSNARAGIPSQGLMQLIPPNFRRYHAAGTPFQIKNPVANIAAAINYIHARYGTIFNTPWARHTGTFYKEGGLVPGYASGTSGAKKGWAWTGEQGPELVNFGGGESVIPNHVLSGYAKGTPLPTSLKNEVRNISSNFIKSSSVIKTAVNTLTNSIKNDISQRKRGKIVSVIDKAGKSLEKLSDRLKASNSSVSSLQSAKGKLSSSVSGAIGGLGDLTSVPFDATAPGGAASSFITGLQGNLSQAKTFSSNLKKLKSKGLSASLISQLAAGGLDQANTVAALAGGSSSNLKTINSLTKQISTLASSEASSVSGAVYNASIKEASASTKKLTAEMKRVANGLEGKVAKKLGIHRASGGFVPHVAGIHGDNVPILATPGEQIIPVGGSAPHSVLVTVAVKGEELSDLIDVRIDESQGALAGAISRKTGREG